MLPQGNSNRSGFRTLTLLLLLSGAAALLVSPAFAGTGVTISADGDHSYYLGEHVVFRGQNADSDSTYLFITGFDLADTGAKLTSPDTAVVSGNTDTFTVVKTQPDKSWEYSYYTANLPFSAGTYTVYAASRPEDVNQLGADAADIGIILKKPYLTAKISSPDVVQGQPFTVSGVAEGIPPEVQVWIIGDNYAYTSTTPVNSEASFAFTADAALTEKLLAGQNYLIVQHPMADNQFDFAVSGDYVRNAKLNNGTNVFRLTGPGSLQGSDAADALITAISEQESGDTTLTSDTYAIIPFQVTTGAGSSSIEGSGVTISADGDKSYYLGEKVVFRGQNADSDSTYLFITGFDLADTGAKLTSPDTAVVSGNTDTFTVVKTQPDKTWEYSYYTADLPFSAGSYTVYAESRPIAADQPGADAATVSIILKKPFLTAMMSSPDVVQGQPFTVNGTAEGNPPEVQVWIIGDNYVSAIKTPVDAGAAFTFTADAALTEKIPAGQNYLIVQHSMADNQFDIVVSGDYVRNLKLDNGTNLFKIAGPGSLQGSDAADALITAISNQEAGDTTLTDDTYAIIPFHVAETGIPSAQAPADAGTPLDNVLHSLEEAFRSLF